MPSAAQSAPPAGRRRARRLPPGLGVLLAMVAVLGIAWALLVPAWQSPDELVHFEYAQHIAETGGLPGIAGHKLLSDDLDVAQVTVRASRGAFFPRFAPPAWSPAAAGAYDALENGRLRPTVTNGGGPSSATSNPPVYYMLASVGSRIDQGGTAFGRLYATRLLGVLLLLLTTLAAWLLAGEVLGRNRLAQLLCAGTVGLLPMVTFMSTSVNPDAMMMTAWTTALWLGARVIRRAAPSIDVLALCAVTAVAILVKATSYALVIPVFVAMLVGWRRQPSGQRGRATRTAAAALLVLAVPVLGWLALAPSLGGTSLTSVSAHGAAFNLRQFLSYVWQYYFPRLPWLKPLQTTPDLAVWHVWIRGGLGVFGWLDVYLSPWVYAVAAGAVAVIAIRAIAVLARHRPEGTGALLLFFALATVCLLGLLHITEYRVVIGNGGAFLQGRYLLPLVSLLGLSVGVAALRLPLRWRTPVGGLVLIGLLTLQCASLGAIAGAYYV